MTEHWYVECQRIEGDHPATAWTPWGRYHHDRSLPNALQNIADMKAADARNGVLFAYRVRNRESGQLIHT